MNDQEKKLLDVISEITFADKNLCKKKLQKIIYLIEQKYVDLGFEYKIHFYGPYSEDLDYTICQLKTENKLKITYTNKGHIISIDSKRKVELDDNSLNVIKEFGRKAPSELELLTTALYVQRNIDNADDEKIIFNVRKIKGNKYSDTKIKDAIKLLKDTNYFV